MNNDLYTVVKATLLGLTIVQFLLVQAFREHKVHNIVLYPDKHSWCKTTTIKQVISYPGCTSVEIDNNVCVGACFSYSIPHTEPSDPGEVIVPYCDSCQPSETTWHQITLQCNKNDAETPSQLIKHVQIIQNCSCTPCEKDSIGVAKFPENNEEFFMQQSADAELLDALQIRNESNFINLNSDRSNKMHSMLSQKLITLLKTIHANNTGHDKELLFDLFSVMQDPTKHKVKAMNIIDFINTLQSNKTDLDTSMLSEILLRFDYSKHYKVEGKPKVNPVNDVQNVAIPSFRLSLIDPLSQSVGKIESAVKENTPIATWIQNSDHHIPIMGSAEFVSEEDLPSIRHDLEKFSVDINAPEKDSAENIGEYKHPVEEATQKVEEVEKEEEEEEKKLHKHLNSHQHHVNENIISHGHLARGPHGALVIEPDRVHEKLDVNEQDLKPNHAGTLLSYHSHSGESNAHK